jgi:hypothetical protein
LLHLQPTRVPGAPEINDYENARYYNTHFDDIFAHAANPPSNITNREFATFFNVLRCFDEDSDHIKIDSSSLYFIFPPFFSFHSAHFEFKQYVTQLMSVKHIIMNVSGRSLGASPYSLVREISLTLGASVARGATSWSRRPLFCPFLISEVVSQEKEERYRMLLQAIAVARTGQYLMR